MVHRSLVDLTLDEIIFNDRNKEYGAYELRRSYNSNLIKSVAIAFLLFALALISPKIIGYFTPLTIKPEIILCEFPLSLGDFVVEKPQIHTVEPVTAIVNNNLAPVIKKDKEVFDEKMPIDIKGIDLTVGAGGTGLPDLGLGTKPDLVELPIEKKIEEPAVVWVGTKQTFKGGELNKFLGNKINYPTIAQNNNVSGRVIVEFVIEKDGSVSGVKTLKGIGFGCDEEAERVIKLTSGMWTPGENNGHAVRLKMVQAIYFKMPENQ